MNIQFKPLNYNDHYYYQRASFVLVKETPRAIRIKLISANKNADGAVFWMPKSVTKSYDDSDPNIKNAWFHSGIFKSNLNKTLNKPSAWRMGITAATLQK